MKTLLRASAAGLLLILPGVSFGSQIQFSACGSQCILYFDPSGSGASELPSPCFYRSYDCRIGSQPSIPSVAFSKTVHNKVSGQLGVTYTLLGDANLDGLVNGADFTILAANFNQPVTGCDQGDFNYGGLVNAADFSSLAANYAAVTDPPADPGVAQTTTASVPLQAPAEMAGAGLAATMLISWLRSRRPLRA